jgi:hypothetical protein
MTDDATSTFQKNLRGQLIQPGDPQYDDARALDNGMIGKRPRMIARCVDAADVMTAVNFGREQGLLIAIRGGGHNGPGLGSVDDSLVIDRSLMKSVRVDPASRTARVGPGCTSGDVDHATHAFLTRAAGADKHGLMAHPSARARPDRASAEGISVLDAGSGSERILIRLATLFRRRQFVERTASRMRSPARDGRDKNDSAPGHS